MSNTTTIPEDRRALRNVFARASMSLALGLIHLTISSCGFYLYNDNLSDVISMNERMWTGSQFSCLSRDKSDCYIAESHIRRIFKRDLRGVLELSIGQTRQNANFSNDAIARVTEQHVTIAYTFVPDKGSVLNDTIVHVIDYGFNGSIVSDIATDTTARQVAIEQAVKQIYDRIAMSVATQGL